MRKKISIGFLVILVLIFGFGIIKAHKVNAPPPTQKIGNGQPMLTTKTITIGKNVILAEVASTDEQKRDGLSGRESLAVGTGMLFIFDAPHTEGFWMKDMRLSLDIIWANGDGIIVTIFKNLSPQTYPTVFKPSVPAQYVLEVPAGYTAQYGIAVGDKIVLQSF